MKQRYILLVEDNPDDEALTLRALKKNSYVDNVQVVRDGVEALDFLNATGTHAGRDKNDLPAVMLLDLKLPKIGGLEVLKALRASGTHTRLLPVVILTSSKEERDLVEGYTNGANSYIRKPVDFDQFVHAIQTLGLYWLVLNEYPPAL